MFNLQHATDIRYYVSSNILRIFAGAEVTAAQIHRYMQAIILAAGMGRRLGALTADNTKCMVEVNGQCLIDRMLNQLSALKLAKIIIITGYQGSKLREHVLQNHPQLKVEFIDNTVYERTNNIYSLWLAREQMAADDTLLLESDIIFDNDVLRLACECPEPDLALVDKYRPWMDGTMVQIDQHSHRILNFIPKKAFRYADADTYYKTVNVYKISRSFARNHYLPFLDAYIKVMGHNEYYEQVLRVITLIDTCPLKALPIDGHDWYEIDDVQDLRIAELIFSKAGDRLKKLHSCYGGYWRYPGMIDFCYLVNPYFPTPRMVDEIKASFDQLLREYPSGAAVNTMLAGKYFGVNSSYMAIGNGAAELIKSLTEILVSGCGGKIGLVMPSFEEYYNRLPVDGTITYVPANSYFRYSADDLVDRFAGTGIKALLIVNPDNPSGNFIVRDDLLRLCDWTFKNGISLVVDESFVDFADGEADEHTLLNDSLLERFPNLIVIKIISKSYGVPGLRLGVAASADTDLISDLQKRCSIWNINSFAEYYMQIYGKYEGDYKTACKRIKDARNVLYDGLSQIDFLRVVPSQSNYFLCEVVAPMTSAELCVKLLDISGILIKDCSGKRGFDGAQYVRIAVRDDNDNRKLIQALKNIKS